MGRGKKIDIGKKVELVEECLAQRIKGREAARRAEVDESTIRLWISQYRAEGVAALQRKGRREYSPEMKQRAIDEYLSGQGSLRTVSEKYKISSPPLLLEWIREYNRHRNSEQEAGGIDMAKTQKMTLEERVSIVKEHLERRKSCSEIASEFGLSYHVVYDWIKKYQALGVAGLEDRRGQRIAQQTPRTPEEELRVRIAQLERENYLLKLERDLLKKVKELERGED